MNLFVVHHEIMAPSSVQVFVTVTAAFLYCSLATGRQTDKQKTTTNKTNNNKSGDKADTTNKQTDENKASVTKKCKNRPADVRMNLVQLAE